MKEGIMRIRKVPMKLLGANNETILKWARKQLNGEEPDLRKSDLKAIREGRLSEVLLKPKKKGFFLPDGTFIEAYEFSPEFGGDLEEAEEEWAKEDELRKWVDKENRHFNKTMINKQKNPTRELWEHGQRMAEFAAKNEMSIYRVHEVLEKRSSADGYSKHAHYTCTSFYEWMPNTDRIHPIFTRSYGLVDTLVRFSSDYKVRDHVRDIILGDLLEGITDYQISLLLGTRNPHEEDHLDNKTFSQINEVRNKLKRCERITENEAIKIKNIFINRVKNNTKKIEGQIV